MRIKKFVISNIILSIILIIVLYGLSWVYINYVNDRTVKFMEYNKLPDNSVDIVTLGSSHGKFGIKLDKKNQMNLALEEQGMYYNLKLFEKYESKIKNGAVVIIPISIFTFYDSNIKEEIEKDERYKNYINLLEKKDIAKNLENSQYFLIKKFSILYPPERIISSFKYLKKIIEEKNISKQNIIYGTKKYNKEQIKKISIETANLFSQRLDSKNSTYGLELTKKLLEKIEKKEGKVVFIIVPLVRDYTEAMELTENKIFKKAVYKNIEIINKELNENILFLDYSKDKRFMDNLDYFMDDDHLNEKGAEYFTEILLKDIEKELKNERKI